MPLRSVIVRPVVLILCFALASVTAAAPDDEPEGRVVVELETSTLAPVGGADGLAFVSGRAFSMQGDALPSYDLVFVIDISDSTARGSGVDLDGDGTVGGRYEGLGGRLRRSMGRAGWLPSVAVGFIEFPVALVYSSLPAARTDTVLHAEVRAVEVMLDNLDPRVTHVGIVTFEGDEDDETPDAFLNTPLTDDYDRVRATLGAILAVGPGGTTNFADAIRLATKTLATSPRRARAAPRMLFLTDGTPTEPFSTPDENGREALRAGLVAAKRGIRIDTFGVGDAAHEHSDLLAQISKATRGTFTPIVSPGDLPRVYEAVEFSEVETLRVRNGTLDVEAPYVTRGADGTFGALLPMRSGLNEISVVARDGAGVEASTRAVLEYSPDAEAAPLALRELRDRTRLLDQRLADIARQRAVLDGSR